MCSSDLGKLTHPLLLAVERDPGFARDLRAWCLSEGTALDPALEARAAAAVRETGALEDSVAFARRLSNDAIRRLGAIPPSRARESLEAVAAALLQRRK